MDAGMLKDKIKEKGVSIKDVISALKIDESTYYRKLSNKKKTFSVEEAQILVNLLELSNQEASKIFLQ